MVLSAMELQLGVFRFLLTVHVDANKMCPWSLPAVERFRQVFLQDPAAVHTHQSHQTYLSYFDRRKKPRIPTIEAPCHDKDGADLFWDLRSISVVWIELGNWYTDIEVGKPSLQWEQFSFVCSYFSFWLKCWLFHISQNRWVFCYPAGAAAGSCFLLVSSFFFFLLLLLSSSSSFFFLLATHLFHTFPYILFWPNLVTMTGTLTTTQAQKMVGSGVTMGSLGSKRSFAPKRHQVLQIT